MCRAYSTPGIVLTPDGRRTSAWFRRAALRRFPFCQWCRRRLTLATSTTDHVRPVSRGGSDELQNLCLSCFGCNQAKGDRWREGDRPGHGPADWAEELFGPEAGRRAS